MNNDKLQYFHVDKYLALISKIQGCRTYIYIYIYMPMCVQANNTKSYVAVYVKR